MSLGFSFVPLALVLVLLLTMVFTGAYGWAVERLAYRPLRGSFRLAPLISAIGMSIALQNYVQLMQGARTKTLQPIIEGGFTFWHIGGSAVSLSFMQILIVMTTVLLMTVFTIVITKTALGRAQRACEQDLVMASLLGIDVDKTISLTFILGAMLAAVAGLMFLLNYGVIDFYLSLIHI